MNNPAEYTNHSGGAKGADLMWDTIGQEFGVTDHRHYRPYHFEVADFHLKEKIKADVWAAAKELGRPAIFGGVDLVYRNWFQVDGAYAIFAIGRIIPPGGVGPKGFKNKTDHEVVDGGTGWAVQMAINEHKPVFVFDMNTNKWYQWSYELCDGCETDHEFVEVGVPTLTKDFAGIGSRELTPEGIEAIRNVYKQTFK